jgi:hypothetical protein
VAEDAIIGSNGAVDCDAECIEGLRMETLDEMHRRHLLTPKQHEQIRAWVVRSKTPQAIMAMPADLWRALALASVLMNVDADLTQPPALGSELSRR